MRQETDYVLHHAQKIIAILAAMRDFTDLLVRGILRQANAGERSTRRVERLIDAGQKEGFAMDDGLITPTVLESLAGSSAFRRGEAYFSVGAVGRLRLADDRIAALVEGNETYQVELRDNRGELAGDCSCPRAAAGHFCKHCVAVGLAWLAEQAAPDKPEATPARARRRDPWREIEAYLATQPPAALIELLLGVARRDDQLYQSLRLHAERTAAGGDVATAFRRAIDDATRRHGFVDWRQAATFARGIDQVADSLTDLLKPDTAAMLVELLEYAIECVETALEEVDDSSGQVGGIVPRLGDLHHKASRMARPEPTELAERLFHLEMTLPFSLWSFDANAYRDVLGKAGLRRYRELAEAEWGKVKPGDRKDHYDVSRARITRVMEQLATASGDVEELVAIKARDLASGYAYLAIAEIWVKAGQPDKALEWAERGLKAFPERPDNRLRDFLVAAYLERQRNGEALALTWVQFEENPSLQAFSKLQEVADKLGIWPVQRELALTRLDDSMAREAATTNRWKPKPSVPNQSLRVEIALWEEDLDAAWAAAHQGICDRHLLIALAGKLEAGRPEDAVSLYRRVVPLIVEDTNNAAYEEATRLIRKVGRLMKALDQSRDFGNYLAELRLQFKPKRNFIKLLDGVARPTASTP
ncbi:cryptochrome/photolyase family protein [Accumulibacter sp.]|uniref:SWIM zinc finger family protein n=1 Tax=Accumulibacter sp. TaxID=2053492 RepID=UPI0025859033|nr:cryptochrome/photolyase family protein [Accumulibacter sp.]